MGGGDAARASEPNGSAVGLVVAATVIMTLGGFRKSHVALGLTVVTGIGVGVQVAMVVAVVLPNMEAVAATVAVAVLIPSPIVIWGLALISFT